MTRSATNLHLIGVKYTYNDDVSQRNCAGQWRNWQVNPAVSLRLLRCSPFWQNEKAWEPSVRKGSTRVSKAGPAVSERTEAGYAWGDGFGALLTEGGEVEVAPGAEERAMNARVGIGEVEVAEEGVAPDGVVGEEAAEPAAGRGEAEQVEAA